MSIATRRSRSGKARSTAPTSNAPEGRQSVRSDGDARVDGQLEVTGDARVDGLDVGKVGAFAYHTSGQEITSDATKYELELEATEFDDFGWHTTSPQYGFDVSEAGTYRADARINWLNTPNAGQTCILYLVKEEEIIAQDWLPNEHSWSPTFTFSRVFRHDGALTDTVRILVELHGSVNRHIEAGSSSTHLSVTKLG